MHMLEKYQTHFQNLTTEQTSHLAEAVSRRYHLPEHPDVPDGVALWQFCEHAGMDQADVVMSLSSDATVTGVSCIEALLGKPIVREVPRTRPTRVRVRGAAVQRSDPRRIVEVAPNPKRPGSASYDRFACYQVGMTVDEALRAGVTMADVKWDTERGFVRLEDAS